MSELKKIKANGIEYDIATDWGKIEGDIANQEDLAQALEGKMPATTKVAQDLSYTDDKLQLKDQDGNPLGSEITIESHVDAVEDLYIKASGVDEEAINYEFQASNVMRKGGAYSTISSNGTYFPTSYTGFPDMAGNRLRSITVNADSNGKKITFWGFDETYPNASDGNACKSFGTRAQSGKYLIFTITNTTAGVSEYMLDGTDDRVTIEKPEAINSCPLSVGINSPSDTGKFMYGNTPAMPSNIYGFCYNNSAPTGNRLGMCWTYYGKKVAKNNLLYAEASVRTSNGSHTALGHPFWITNVDNFYDNMTGKKLNSIKVQMQAANSTLYLYGADEDPNDGSVYADGQTWTAACDSKMVLFATIKAGTTYEEYKFDGSDSRVTILDQDMVNNLPKAIGVDALSNYGFKFGDKCSTGESKYTWFATGLGSTTGINSRLGLEFTTKLQEVEYQTKVKYTDGTEKDFDANMVNKALGYEAYNATTNPAHYQNADQVQATATTTANNAVANRLTAANILAGQNITLTKSGNNVTIATGGIVEDIYIKKTPLPVDVLSVDNTHENVMKYGTGYSDSNLSLGTFWPTNINGYFKYLPGTQLKSVTINATTGGKKISFWGYDGENTLSCTESAANAQAFAGRANAAKTNIFNIINTTAGVSEYLLDGTDDRVEILDQDAIDSCPKNIGFGATTDTSQFKYGGSAKITSGKTGFAWGVGAGTTTLLPVCWTYVNPNGIIEYNNHFADGEAAVSTEASTEPWWMADLNGFYADENFGITGKKLRSFKVRAQNANSTMTLWGANIEADTPSALASETTQAQLNSWIQAVDAAKVKIATITTRSTNYEEYMLDGTDPNVKIENQEMIDSCPKALGFMPSPAGFYFVTKASCLNTSLVRAFGRKGSSSDLTGNMLNIAFTTQAPTDYIDKTTIRYGDKTEKPFTPELVEDALEYHPLGTTNILQGSNITLLKDGDNVTISATGSLSPTVEWGTVVGDITTQLDLQGALSNKQNKLVAGPGIEIDDETNEIMATASSPLAGKKLSFIGDSISTFQGWMPSGYAVYYPSGTVTNVEQTWWKKLLAKSGMILGQNCAWSGSKVTGNTSSTTSASSAASTRRVDDLALNGTPDIIICYIGINDIRTGIAAGTWTKDDAIPADSSNIATFAEAYAIMVSKVMNTYKNAKVFCCSLLETTNMSSGSGANYPIKNANNFTLPQLNAKIREICDGLGAGYIDLHACGITHWNCSQYMTDGTLHPNEAGHTLMCNAIYTGLLNYYTK